jgi:hypothetical protein
MAMTLMRDPRVKMHGPEHHFLVPAVLLAAWCNATGRSGADRAAMLAKARTRAADVKGGFCGTHGSCGAAMGTGIFVSVATGATPLSREQWRLSNLMTAESLMTVARQGGPRCCKRDTFLSLQSAADFLAREMGVRIQTRAPVCEWSGLNKECLGAACAYNAQAEPAAQKHP